MEVNVLDPARRELRRSWKVLLAASIGNATGTSGLPLYTLGLFIVPFADSFRWTRAEVSTANLINIFALVIALPIAGRVADRIGCRPVAIASMIGTILGYLGFQLLTRSILSFYIASAALAVAGVGTLQPTWTRVIAETFERKRGLAIAITLLGTGVSSVLGPPLVAAAIDRFGWRGGYLTLAAIACFIGLPVVAGFFREPERRSTMAGAPAGPDLVAGLSLAEAVRRRTFWQLALGIFLAGGSIAAFIIHLVPLLTSHGLTRSLAVSLASGMGIAVILGRLVMGGLLDRVPVGAVAGIGFALAGCAFVLAGSGHPSLLMLQIVVGIIGINAGSELNLVTFATAKYFGLRNYNQICSLLFVFLSFGVGLAPVGAGLIYDRFHSYDVALKLGAVAVAIGAILFATLGPHPKTFASAAPVAPG